MRPLILEEISRVTQGKLISGMPGTTFRGVAIDSRKAMPGDLFFALRGERADGHDFINEVVLRGAAGAVIQHEVALSPEASRAASDRGFALILVPSTLQALSDLAGWYRRQLDITVIGVTGSVGKTSTKDMIGSVLAQKYPTYRNPGNLNSHIGLPVAILGMQEGTRYAVLEMAMRGRGEISSLCNIALPKIGVLTDISASHIGLLGSIEEIAMAKAELLESLPADGLAVLASDNEWIRKVSHRCACRKVFYGFSDGADCRAVEVKECDENGSLFTVSYRGCSFDVRLPVPGRHQIQNALAAVALGMELGLSVSEVQRGLETVALSPMRTEVIRTPFLTIINDAYNASPKSMMAALDLLSGIAGGRRVAILGDMLELGAYAPFAHREVGKYARGKADYLVASGEQAYHIKEAWDEDETAAGSRSSWFRSKDEAAGFLDGFLMEGDTCLVKASRGMGFESLVDFLRSWSPRGRKGEG